MKILIFIILLSACLTGSTSAQLGDGSGTSSGEMLDMDIGSRATALGGAFTAFSDDATAIFWNPSGLGSIKSVEVQFGYCNWYQDISLNYLGAAIPVSDRITSGFGIKYVDLGSFQGYSAEDLPTGEFGGHNIVIGLSIGFKATSKLSFGITANGIFEKIEESTASGLAFDVGTRLTSGAFSFGLALKNAGPGLKYEYERSPLPAHLDAGFGFRAFDERFIMAADIIVPRDGFVSMRQGVEYLYLNTIYLRGGYRHSFDSADGSGSDGMVYGFGIKIMAGSIGYSFTPDGDLGSIHRIDLSFKVDH
jgi:hypothetical protein